MFRRFDTKLECSGRRSRQTELYINIARCIEDILRTSISYLIVHIKTSSQRHEVGIWNSSSNKVYPQKRMHHRRANRLRQLAFL